MHVHNHKIYLTASASTSGRFIFEKGDTKIQVPDNNAIYSFKLSDSAKWMLWSNRATSGSNQISAGTNAL